MTRIHGWIVLAGAALALAGCESNSSSTGSFLAIPDITTPSDSVAVPVTLKFSGVRTFLNNAGDESDDEWDQIAPVLRRYHEVGNAYGVEYHVTPRLRPSPPLGLRVTDYTVEMVVKNMSALANMNDEIAAKRGKIIAGKRVDFAASNITVNYATPYVGGEIETLFFGKADSGEQVYLFDHGAAAPRRVEVDAAGRWRATVRVSTRKDYVYGYRVDARGEQHHFRISVVSRVEEPMTPASFEEARASGL